MDKQIKNEKVKTKNDKEKLKIVEEIILKIIALLGIEVKTLVEEKEGVIRIQLETEEPGILIGYHGEALAALQQMISLMVFKKLGAWVRILVNVGDYREKREEALTNMAKSLAQKAKFSGLPQNLPPMSPAERRIIHLALANETEVETISEGEGRERHVVIKPVIMGEKPASLISKPKI